jgi:hypothetical protein
MAKSLDRIAQQRDCLIALCQPVYHDHESALCLVQPSRRRGEDLMSDQMDGSWSRLAGFAMTVTRRDDAHHPDITSFNGSLHNERLNVRFWAWRRAFVIFGIITGILVAVLIGLFLTLGMASHAASPALPASGAASSSSSSDAASPSSQTAQTLAVAGVIIGCVSAIGTLLSGWSTLVTARAMARQDVAPHAPRARAKPTKPRTRKM